MKLSYREDIDGLRAVSVLAVLLNHAGIDMVSGGFVGVDIFFVISGYLITSIVVREIWNNEFSLIRFYGRRIRRILPALFFVMAFTVLVCSIMYDAEKFFEFGKSIIAATLFGSNIIFWKESGYFDAPSQLKPLLHTWSLAVEEQFYIFFPLFLFVIHRYAKKFSAHIFAITALISFVFSVSVSTNDASAAFYLANLRAWELLVGCILALNIIPQGQEKKFSNIIGIIGLFLIAFSIFQYSETTKFPGVSALAPVFGAAFIVSSGKAEKSLSKSLLSMPLLVFIGKISYSLYLWHWPIIIFARYYMIRQMTSTELTSVLIIILLISTLSWRFVETPFRSKLFMKTHQIYAFAFSSMILMLLIGGTIYYFKGFPNRAGLEYLAIDTKKEETWLFKECNINLTDDPQVITACEIGDHSQEASFMVWGDSHAPTYGKAIHISATKQELAGILTYSPGCPTLLNITPTPKIGDLPCIKYNEMALSYLEDHPEIKTVLLGSRWTLWLEGSRYKQEEGIPTEIQDALNEAPPGINREELFTIGLERTITAITKLNRNVILIAPLPEIGYDVPSLNFIASRTGRDINQIISPSTEEYLARNNRTLAILRMLGEKFEVPIVESWEALCQENVCRSAVNGIPLYDDDDHLSIFGSELISTTFDPFFVSIKSESK